MFENADLATELLRYAGLLGVACYVTAYTSLQLGLMRGASVKYTLLNMTAASLVLLSLSADFNLSSAMIQIIWIAISMVGLARFAVLNSITRFSADEERLFRSKLSGLSRPLAKSLMKSGNWIEMAGDAVITRQGQKAGSLFFLAEGDARVEVDGVIVSHCAPGSFVGEMTCLDRAPATATVTTSGPARLFEISSDKLIRLCARNQELRSELEAALSNETKSRLVEANLRMASAG